MLNNLIVSLVSANKKKGRINANVFSINVNPYSGSYFSNRVNRLRNIPLQ